MITNSTKILFIVLIYSTLTRESNCAFPLERDLQEVTGISPPKDWIVFMERRIWLCWRLLTKQLSVSLCEILQCVAGNITSGWRCINRAKRNEICMQGLNAFTNGIEPRFWGTDVRVTFKVHQAFNINITVTFLTSFPSDGMRSCSQRLELGNPGDMFTYTDPEYPVTIVDHSNSMTLSLHCRNNHCVIIEYSVASPHVYTNIKYRMSEAPVSFKWSHFRIYLLRFQVHKIARVSLHIAPCTACKIMVYDGPSYCFPQIIEKKLELTKPSTVRASTFYLFAVLVHTEALWNTSFSYEPDFHETKAIHLSDMNEFTLFNNGSQCRNPTHYIRLCLFKLKSPNTKRILLSIRQIDFEGRLHGSNLFACVAVFDVMDGSLVELFELLHDVNPNVEPFEATSTNNTMYILAYSYTEFANVDFEIVGTVTECITMTLVIPSQSYPDKQSPLFFNLRVLSDSHCLRVQPAITHCSKLVYHFILPFDVPVKIHVKAVAGTAGRRGYFPEAHGDFYLIRRRIGSTKFNYFFFGKFHDIKVTYYEPWWLYVYMELVSMPCQVSCSLPCSGNVASGTVCNICQNYYIGNQFVGIIDNKMFVPRMLSNRCPAPTLYIRNKIVRYSASYAWYISRFKVYSNSVVVLPLFSGGSEIRFRGDQNCCMEIPIGVVKKKQPMPTFDNTGCNHDRPKITKPWNGYLYTIMQNEYGYVSWNDAEISCQFMNGFLATVNSQGEYNFIRQHFFSEQEAMLLFVGIKQV